MSARTALVTGAAGFVGRALVRRLAGGGWRVTGLGHGAFPDHGAHGLAQWINGTVDAANLDAAGVDFDAVFHLAGGSSVGPSLARPFEDFERTAVSTMALLDWARRRGLGAPVVLASSAAVYGAGHAGPIAESAERAPMSPYGAHKAMAEMAAEGFTRDFGLRVAVVRLFSVYGAGLAKQLLWDACRKAVAGERAFGGSGEELRDFVHADDAADLLARAADAPGGWTVLNGGTGIATRVADLLGLLFQELGAGAPVFTGEARAGDPRSLVADPARALALDWRPGVALADGVAEYARWFRARG